MYDKQHFALNLIWNFYEAKIYYGDTGFYPFRWCFWLRRHLEVYLPLPIVTWYNRSVITALQDNYIGNTLVICRSRKSGIRHAWRCLVQLCENEGMIDVSMLVKHAEKGINSQGLSS